MTSLCLGVRGVNTVLCSCGEDYIIVWDIERVQLAVADGMACEGGVEDGDVWIKA